MAKERGLRSDSENSGSRTQAQALKAAKAHLWQIEDEWMEARLLGDAASTAALLDDSYKGATSRGKPQTKADFIKTIETSTGFFKEHVHSGRNIAFRGDIAISTGVATLISPARAHSFRYLRVFHGSNEAWKLIASQSTPVD